MGTIKATNIEPIADNGTVTLGSSGDQFTLATGAKSSFLYPAFEAYRNADQTSITSGTATKAQFDTEVFDTDNCYDNSSNYRFTPTVAGKYFVYAALRAGNTNGSAGNMNQMRTWIYKNGSAYRVSATNFDTGDVHNATETTSTVVDMNGTSDYVEVYVQAYVNSGTVYLIGGSNITNLFGAYRIGS